MTLQPLNLHNQVFKTMKDARAAILDLVNRYHWIYQVKHSRPRFYSICCPNQKANPSVQCPFQVCASRNRNHHITVKVKSLEHKCNSFLDGHQSTIGHQWVKSKAARIMQDVSTSIKPRVVMRHILHEHGTNVKYSTAWRAREAFKKEQSTDDELSF